MRIPTPREQPIFKRRRPCSVVCLGFVLNPVWWPQPRQHRCPDKERGPVARQGGGHSCLGTSNLRQQANQVTGAQAVDGDAAARAFRYRRRHVG